MARKIIWSKDAGDELYEIIAYIKHNTGKITAEKIYRKIMDKIKWVSENAKGRRAALLLKDFGIHDIHQVNIKPWVFYYRVENDEMNILSVIDGRRNLEEILYKKIIEGKIR
jgi:toxin ParE1/3/4